MPKLTLYFPPEFDDPAWAGSSFCLDAPGGDHKHGRAGEWVLGRHPAADVTIASRTVSARHAAIAYSYAADRWSIQDLGSTNGTRINSELLAEGLAPHQIGRSPCPGGQPDPPGRGRRRHHRRRWPHHHCQLATARPPHGRNHTPDPNGPTGQNLCRCRLPGGELAVCTLDPAGEDLPAGGVGRGGGGGSGGDGWGILGASTFDEAPWI